MSTEQAAVALPCRCPAVMTMPRVPPTDPVILVMSWVSDIHSVFWLVL